MANIFISYASEDRPRAKVLAEALERHEWSVWWDRKISVGSIFDKEIEQALGTSRCVIVLWSKAAVASEWVREEADEGKRRGILAPILLEEVKLPMGFGRIQTANLTDWQPGVPHPEFDQLLIAIARILQTRLTLQAKTAAEARSPESNRSVRGVSIGSQKPNIHPRSIPDKAPASSPAKPSNPITHALIRYWPVVLATSVILLAVSFGIQRGPVAPHQEEPNNLVQGITETTPVAPETLRWVRFSSYPPAQLYLDQSGVKTGPHDTPYDFQASRGEHVSWQLKQKGYQDKAGSITVGVNNIYKIPLTSVRK